MDTRYSGPAATLWAAVVVLATIGWGYVAAVDPLVWYWQLPPFAALVGCLYAYDRVRPTWDRPLARGVVGIGLLLWGALFLIGAIGIIQLGLFYDDWCWLEEAQVILRDPSHIFNRRIANTLRPVAHCWATLQYVCFDLWEPGYHLSGLALHGVVVWQVYRLALSLDLEPWQGKLAALIASFPGFGIEALLWVSSHANLILMNLVLAAIHLGARSWHERQEWQGLAMVGLGVMMLGTKEEAALFVPAVAGFVILRGRTFDRIAAGGLLLLWTAWFWAQYTLQQDHHLEEASFDVTRWMVPVLAVRLLLIVQGKMLGLNSSLPALAGLLVFLRRPPAFQGSRVALVSTLGFMYAHALLMTQLLHLDLTFPGSRYFYTQFVLGAPLFVLFVSRLLAAFDIRSRLPWACLVVVIAAAQLPGLNPGLGSFLNMKAMETRWINLIRANRSLLDQIPEDDAIWFADHPGGPQHAGSWLLFNYPERRWNSRPRHYVNAYGGWVVDTRIPPYIMHFPPEQYVPELPEPWAKIEVPEQTDAE